MLVARARYLVLAAALLASAACSRTPRTDVEPIPRTMLQVDNQAFLDMNIYVVYLGQRRRVGIAHGARKTTMELPMRFRTMESLQFIADPIGSSRTPVSSEIMVSPGDVVMMVIPPQ